MRFLFLLLSIASIVVAFRTQSVGVKGKLFCGQDPAKNILVKLIDQDAGSGPDPDDHISQTNSDENGEFSLSGSTEEISLIDPELRIYHDCNSRGRVCLRKWKIRIPSKYITDGPEPKLFMDMGEMNLEVELEKEAKTCK